MSDGRGLDYTQRGKQSPGEEWPREIKTFLPPLWTSIKLIAVRTFSPAGPAPRDVLLFGG